MTRMILFWIVTLVAVDLVTAQSPQIIRGPYLQLGTSSSIIVRWRTDIPCDSIVNWGAAPGMLTNTVSDGLAKTEHEVQLTMLPTDAQVFYAIEATGAGVLAGDDATHYFKTSPPAGTAKPTRLWILGDAGTANSDARAVRDAYLAYTDTRHTDLMLMLGDNAYPDGTDAQYQSAVFQGMYEDVLKQTVLWSCLGNHDAIAANAALESGPFYDIFNNPKAAEAGGLASGTESYYSFDYGNIHFVVLDSQQSDRSPTGAMATWLQNDLAANTLDWTIAYWHHPPYTKGSHDSDTEARLVQMRENFLPILENYGVDLVLGGHSHCYERSWLLDGHYGSSVSFDPVTHRVSDLTGRAGFGGAYRKNVLAGGSHDGCVYVVAGASGKISGGTFNHPAHFYSVPVLGSLVVDIDGSQLDARYITDDGFLLDFFSIVKDGVTPVVRTQLPVFYAQPWRFDDTGTDLGTAWRAPGYDDSAWATGTSPLGYGETWIQGPVSFGGNPSNVHPTTYFRREMFVAIDPQAIEAFRAAVLYDDGCVIYLNGVEVWRSPSMPTGPVTYNTLASSHEAVGPELVELLPFTHLLVPGTNHLAVEVHQTSASSSDLAFEIAIQLDGRQPFLGPEAAGQVVNATGGLESVFRINGTDGGFGRSVDVKVGEAFSFAVDTPSVQTTPAPFTLFGYVGTPGPADVFALPSGLTPMLFPPAYPGVPAPLSFLVGDNFLGLTGAMAYTSPAPWSDMNPGLPFPGVYTFQGWISNGAGGAATFNAIRMQVIP